MNKVKFLSGYKEQAYVPYVNGTIQEICSHFPEANPIESRETPQPQSFSVIFP